MTERGVTDTFFFAQSVTLLLGSVSIGYGILTFAFGPALWDGPGTVYNTAQSVPGAPQSWGLVAIVAGALVVVGQMLNRHKLIATGALLMGLWFLFFAVSFAFDIAGARSPFGSPGVVVYAHLCVLMLLRSRVRLPGGARWAGKP